MHPGFFEQDFIRSMPEDMVCSEMMIDLRTAPPLPSCGCPDGITFGEYRGEIGAMHDAVNSVVPGWVQYYPEGGRFFCAFDGEKIASFCVLEDIGVIDGVRIGAPGCVGTVPEYRRRGIGLEMVRRATETLRREGYDISWIHFTHLAGWYSKLGYSTVLRWNRGGFLPEE